MVLTFHEMTALSKARALGAWWNTAMRFSVHGSVWGAIATRCSSSARIVIADIGIAARVAVRQRVCGNTVKPTAAIKVAWKANGTTWTGNTITCSANPKRN
jgi:hypothetical protein